MARGFGMTALRAALGGVAGYGQDVAARREREKVETEMARQQERQAAMDRLAMRREGYMTPEEAGAAKKTGGAAVLRAALTGARDQVAIDQGLSAAAPQQAETFGGKTYTRESPFAAAAREADRALYQEREKEKRKQAAKQAEVTASEQRLGAAFPGINRARLAAVAAGDVDLKDVLPPKPERAPRTGPTEEELDIAEGIWNSNIGDPALRRSMETAFNRMRQGDKRSSPRQLIYKAVQGALREQEARLKAQPRGQGGGMGLGTGDAQLDAAIAGLGGQAAAPAPVAAQAPTAALSAEDAAVDEWMDANPQGPDEPDAAYKARYNASRRGR
jgi:hypothetical protein